MINYTCVYLCVCEGGTNIHYLKRKVHETLGRPNLAQEVKEEKMASMGKEFHEGRQINIGKYHKVISKN